MNLIENRFWKMKLDDFENEMDMLIDYQERDENNLGDKLFNFKKLVVFLMKIKDSYISIENFCKVNYEPSKLKGIEEALFMITSVLESLEDIRTVVAQGIDLNDNSKRRIEEILKSGRLEFFKANQQASFQFRIIMDNNNILNPHDFEDFYSFSKIKINQRLSQPAKCFRDFFEIFSKVQELMKIFNEMIMEGLTPKQSLLKEFCT